nr:M14 family metallopeptidase [uncultured Albidiferax sp.]
MHRTDHVLRSQSIGSQKTLSSFHFGTPGARPKVYIQASLHAEELPGMLVAYHLRRLLEKAEALGQIQGEIILVPLANPIGQAQRVDHKPMGRFDLNTSENFNRHFPDLCAAVLPLVEGKLGSDAAANVATIRAAMATHLDSWQPATELASQRKRLVSMAFDADVVLDLHCDLEAVMHLYAETPCWPVLEPLARLLGAQAVLLAKNSGGLSFDESMSGPWWQLAEKLPFPIPQACTSTTVELRGEADISHALGQADAAAIFGYLQHLAVIGGEPPVLPELACAATPLAGAQYVKSPVPGVLVFAAQPGDHLALGALVAEIIDPVSGHVHALRAEVPGVMYARTTERYATPGDDLANIAGSVPFRTGNLLGA